MKKVEVISENKDYTAVNVGSWHEISGHGLIHPKFGTEIKGKYFHIHNKDEETYIVIKGSGYFQVDDDCFPIKEGSVIRVAPAGVRGLCNSSDEEMVYMCIQSKENSLEEYSSEDGQRVSATPKWNLNR